MCFSATASFTLSAILISTGVVAAITSYNTNKNYLFFSLIPIIFGVQQCFEGVIWWLVHTGDVSSIPIYGYFYLFFAFYFWPAYVPITVYYIEEDLIRKKILYALMIAGLILGAVLFVPILFGIIPITVATMGRSIQYGTYPWGPLSWFYSGCYTLVLILSLLFSSVPRINVFGFMVLTSMMISYWWYINTFTSVWCFFAAILSFYITYIIYNLPIKERLTLGAVN